MQVCTSLQTDNHTSTPPLTFLQAGCPSCRPTNSIKALKAGALKVLESAGVFPVAQIVKQWKFLGNGFAPVIFRKLVLKVREMS